MSDRLLPSKISGYLRRLQLSYQNNGPQLGPTDRAEMSLLWKLIASARVYVREDVEFYTDDSVGHDVLLFAPLGVLGLINLDADEKLRTRLVTDLRRCAAALGSEYVRAVAFEPEDQADIEFQRSRPVAAENRVAPESVSFWSPGEIRLFLSHRDSHKVEARLLSDELKAFGVSAFVAHDTIEPMSSWRNEILKALETMEVMLAFITDDFDASTWTQQEVGYALGRGIPVISLQLEARAPSGFIETTQAIRGRLDNPHAAAIEIYQVLAEKLDNSKRLLSGLIAAFCSAGNFIDARDRFDRLAATTTKLSDSDFQTIVKAFSDNDQLYGSVYLRHEGHNRLLSFLQRTTGKRLHFDYNASPKIKEIKASPDLDDEIPF